MPPSAFSARYAVRRKVRAAVKALAEMVRAFFIAMGKVKAVDFAKSK